MLVQGLLVNFLTNRDFLSNLNIWSGAMNRVYSRRQAGEYASVITPENFEGVPEIICQDRQQIIQDEAEVSDIS